MRHNDAVRRLLGAIVSILLGAVATVTLAIIALIGADESTGGSSSLLIRNGTELWLVRRHESFGLTWINSELYWPPLVNSQPTSIDIPWWATPPERQWPETGLPRVAALAVGWPAPFVARRWIALRSGEIFPLPHELDDGRDSLRRAAGRFREADAAAPYLILWRGLLLDVGVLSLAFGALIWGLATLRAALFHRQERNDEPHEQKQRDGETGHAQE